MGKIMYTFSNLVGFTYKEISEQQCMYMETFGDIFTLQVYLRLFQDLQHFLFFNIWKPYFIMLNKLK